MPATSSGFTVRKVWGRPIATGVSYDVTGTRWLAPARKYTSAPGCVVRTRVPGVSTFGPLAMRLRKEAGTRRVTGADGAARLFIDETDMIWLFLPVPVM